MFAVSSLDDRTHRGGGHMHDSSGDDGLLGVSQDTTAAVPRATKAAGLVNSSADNATGGHFDSVSGGLDPGDSTGGDGATGSAATPAPAPHSHSHSHFQPLSTSMKARAVAVGRGSSRHSSSPQATSSEDASSTVHDANSYKTKVDDKYDIDSNPATAAMMEGAAVVAPSDVVDDVFGYVSLFPSRRRSQRDSILLNHIGR